MSSSSKIKILIVEDYKKIAETWASILTQEGYEVVGICDGETEALKKAKETNPDVILMDINLKEGNGLGCTASLKLKLPNCKVIVLSMYNDQNHLQDFFKAGAVGYVTKDSSIKEVLKAIETVLQGGEYICNDMKDV